MSLIMYYGRKDCSSQTVFTLTKSKPTEELYLFDKKILSLSLTAEENAHGQEWVMGLKKNKMLELQH